MPTPGQLTKKVAATLGVDDTTVATTWRALREAELVTKGGRGRSAAQVTARDAASLIFAVCGSSTIKDAADYVARSSKSHGVIHRSSGWVKDFKRFGRGDHCDSPAWLLECLGIEAVTTLPTAHSSIDVLEGFIDWAGQIRFNTGVEEENTTPTKIILSQFEIAVSFESPDGKVHYQVFCEDKDGRKYVEDQSYFPEAQPYFDGRRLTDDAIRGLRAENHSVRTTDLTTVRSFTRHTLTEVGRFIAGVEV